MEVEDYSAAVAWVAQTAMRKAIGRATVAEVATRRDQLDEELKGAIEEQLNPWGITIIDVEIRDIVLPKELQEAMAQEAVAEGAHYETVAEYPGGGRDVQRVVDVPGVPARPAWTEQLPIKRYIRYTAEELAAKEAERKKAEAREKLPDTVAALQEDNKTLKKENEMLKQCLLEMSEIVYA